MLRLLSTACAVSLSLSLSLSAADLPDEISTGNGNIEIGSYFKSVYEHLNPYDEDLLAAPLDTLSLGKFGALELNARRAGSTPLGDVYGIGVALYWQYIAPTEGNNNVSSAVVRGDYGSYTVIGGDAAALTILEYVSPMSIPVEAYERAKWDNSDLIVATDDGDTLTLALTSSPYTFFAPAAQRDISSYKIESLRYDVAGSTVGINDINKPQINNFAVGAGTVKVYSTSGRLISKFHSSRTSLMSNINALNMPQGIYVVQGAQFVQKINIK